MDAITAASRGRAAPGGTIVEALDAIVRRFGGAEPQTILICGSLFLAGEALKADGYIPD